MAFRQIRRQPAAADPDDERDGLDRVQEHDLPVPMRTALETARASRPGRRVVCIAFYTRENGQETARKGVSSDRINGVGRSSIGHLFNAKHLLVLSVSVTETTAASVRAVTHVLVTRTEP
jgi:hypothetical protein